LAGADEIREPGIHIRWPWLWIPGSSICRPTTTNWQG